MRGLISCLGYFLVVLIVAVVLVNWWYSPKQPVAFPFPSSEQPLIDDTAYAEISHIVLPLTDVRVTGLSELKERNCFATPPIPTWEKECFAEYKDKQSILSAFDDWLKKPGKYKLPHPINAGRHSRIPISENYQDSGPKNFVDLVKLSKLLMVRGVLALRRNDFVAAHNDFEQVFQLGEFVQFNGNIVQIMIAARIFSMAFLNLLEFLPADQHAEKFITILPKWESTQQALRLALANEWHTGLVGAFADVSKEFSTRHSMLVKLFGKAVLDKQHTSEVQARAFGDLIRCLDQENLSYACDQITVVTGKERYWIRWLHNPLGRWALSGKRNPAMVFKKYVKTAAITADYMSALQVILAARAFYSTHKSWPINKVDITPTYIPVWPKAVWNGKSLLWLQNSSGIDLQESLDKERCPIDSCPTQISFIPKDYSNLH